jgi:hypothetical protein
VEKANPQVGENLGPEPLIFGLGRFNLKHFGFFDERTDDKGLEAAADLVTNKLVDPVAAFGFDKLRPDRLSPGRKFVN